MTQASVTAAPNGAPMDKNKRNWIVATCAVGGVGVAAVAVPFVSTFQPSEKAKATGAAV
ncbi:MAG: ubiquinol-cytochrome c reductase iron-sulfur subunit, partial [Polaromonas sp.]|nr:ubiquinol-cytochrome c reductase iron-sulfur subunit [Polaromonas sp.]